MHVLYLRFCHWYSVRNLCSSQERKRHRYRCYGTLYRRCICTGILGSDHSADPFRLKAERSADLRIRYAGILHTSESCAGCALRRKYCANHQNQYAGSTGTGLHPYREGKGCHALGRYLEARPEKCHDPDRNSRRYRFWLHADRIHADRKGILHSGNR